MKKRLAVIAIGSLALIASVSVAKAQVLCGERSNFLRHLGKNHQEAPTSMGLTSTGKVIEVLTSKKGTWTIIITEPNGKSCLVAAGEAWETIKRLALKPAT